MAFRRFDYFEAASADQDASSGAEVHLRCYHRGKGPVRLPPLRHTAARHLPQNGSKLDLEIDFNYGSRLTINSQ